jgi:peptidyl-dipeptidase Dcp
MTLPRRAVIGTALILPACSRLPGCAAPPGQAPATTATAASLHSQGTTPGMTGNPFLAPSTLPFEAPPFDRITDGDYAPALEAGMRERLAEVERIANETSAPTFANTYLALEKSGALLHRVRAAFDAITGADTNDTLQKVQEDAAPKLAANDDAVYLDARLFARLQKVYDERASLALDPESLRLVEVVYGDFVRHGAKLPAADQAMLRELNREESTLSTAFANKLLAATKDAALVVDDKAKLAGLSDAGLAAAQAAAHERGLEGKYLLSLHNTTQQPELRDLRDRATRQALFAASWNRAERGDANDTRQSIERLAQLRAQQARLLGFPSYAAWKLENQMAKTPQAVDAFLDQLAPAAVARARREAADIQTQIDADQAARDAPTFPLAAPDWNRYAEQVRKAKYDLDESQLKPYFELDNVLRNGVFYAANRLYGLSFKERHDLPAYQPDVRVFEVMDADGKSLALFYADYFKRDNKSGGAWMGNFVEQSKLLGHRPVIYNVANFAKPPAGQPALLSFDDVITMFHEFGHALHGMFADQQYPTLSGTNTARDFVEFPSQFNEHWATNPEVLAHYARHYATGAAMPKAVLDRLLEARQFNAGYDMTEAVAASVLDLRWHTLDATAPLQDADRFEATALKDGHVDLGYVPPRYRSSYFLHIWSNGYAAGYYAYQWTQMLADDAFVGFKEQGGLSRANGQRFREQVLSRGNSQDLAQMYRTWRGHAPGIEPMLEYRGLQAAPK